MRKDRRGIGGFMETMMAMMIVTIAISAFMTVFTYTNLEQSEPAEISTDFLDGLSIRNDRIVGLDKDYPEKESLRKGYDSMTVCIRTVGSIHDYQLELGRPTNSSDQIIKNGNIILTSESGERYAAVYEVIAFV